MHGNVMDDLQRFYTYGGYLKPALVRYWTCFVHLSHSQDALILVKSFSFRYTCVIVGSLYATRELSYSFDKYSRRVLVVGSGGW